MKLSLSAGLLLIAAVGWAQSNPFFGFQPFAQLKDFLQLSDSQLQSILNNNDDFNHYAATKQSRIAQVQSEIAAETAKETLDPMDLGVRYVEIESICRDLKNQALTYQQKNTSLLTDPQKAKLQVLQDAMKLAPVIRDALTGNLMGTFDYAPAFFAGTNGGIVSISVPLGGAGYAFGCYSYMPFPGNIIPANRTSNAYVPEPKLNDGGLGGGVFRVGGGVTTPVRLLRLEPGSNGAVR